MKLRIEFTVADFRRCGLKQNWLLFQLKERINHTPAMKNPYPVFYPCIGLFNEKRRKENNSAYSDYFHANHFLRFTSFEKHTVELSCTNKKGKPLTTTITRRDHINRFFLADKSGMKNRLRLDLECRLDDSRLTAVNFFRMFMNLPVKIRNTGKKGFHLSDVSHELCRAIAGYPAEKEPGAIRPLQTLAVVEYAPEEAPLEMKYAQTHTENGVEIEKFKNDSPRMDIYFLRKTVAGKENDAYTRQLRSTLLFLASELYLLWEIDKDKALAKRVMKKAMRYWLDIKKHIRPEFLFLLTSGLLTDPEKLKKLEQKYNPPPLLEILNEELE